MPTKLGRGGSGPEDFDPDTGEYVAGNTVSKRGNTYWVHGDVMSRKISKEKYDEYKKAGYKEDFDTNQSHDILSERKAEIDEIMNKNEKYGVNYYNRKYYLGKLLDSEAGYTETLKSGEDLYNRVVSQRAEELLKTFPKQQQFDVTQSSKNSNIGLTNLMDEYTYKEDGKTYWKSGADYKQLNKDFWNYNNNCQRCVVAWYLNYLGYSCKAKPRDAKGKYMSQEREFRLRQGSDDKILYDLAPAIQGFQNWDLNAFIIPDKTEWDYRGTHDETPDEQFMNIEDTVKDSPDKSVFFCTVRFKNGGGHVFIALNDGGQCKLIEPQSNSTHDRKYFNSINLRHTKLIRVNDFELNGEMIPLIVDKLEPKKQEDSNEWKTI